MGRIPVPDRARSWMLTMLSPLTASSFASKDKSPSVRARRLRINRSKQCGARTCACVAKPRSIDQSHAERTRACTSSQQEQRGVGSIHTHPDCQVLPQTTRAPAFISSLALLALLCRCLTLVPQAHPAVGWCCSAFSIQTSTRKATIFPRIHISAPWS